MAKPLVGVVLGSRADFNVMRRALESLRVMGIPYILEIGSPHRSPNRLVEFVQTAGEQGIEIIICASGGSASVAGFLASYTTLPIIGVPVDSTPLRGQDALLSMVQQPPGVPVAVVGINNGENAVQLAAQILALKHPQFRDVLAHGRLNLQKKIDTARADLLHEFPDLCDPLRTSPATMTSRRDSDEDTDPGSEGETPEPAIPSERTRLKPGSIYFQSSNNPPAQSLVQTPEPQEPYASISDAENVTEDSSLSNDSENLFPDSPWLNEHEDKSDLPAPPSNDDLTSVPEARVSEDVSTRENFQAELGPMEDPDKTPVDPNFHQSLSKLPGFEKAFSVVETKVFDIEHEDPNIDILSHAMMVILEGGIVAFPTDTVYGLAADATNSEAVKRLYEVKGQSSQEKSLSVLIHSMDMLDVLVKEVPPGIESTLDKFWPGGLTVIFPKHPSVLKTVSESPNIAVRIPNDDIPLKLMEMVQRPLAVINAAKGENNPATDGSQVHGRFDTKIECILDAGACKTGTASTVLSVITEPYEILREGLIPVREIKDVLGDRLRDI